MKPMPNNMGPTASAYYPMGGMGAGTNPTQAMMSGDWICPSCRDLVFARNNQCRRCSTPRPLDSQETAVSPSAPPDGGCAAFPPAHPGFPSFPAGFPGGAGRCPGGAAYPAYPGLNPAKFQVPMVGTVGCNPSQRAEFWKRRINREGLTVVSEHESLLDPGLNARLDALSQGIQIGRVEPASRGHSSSGGSSWSFCSPSSRLGRSRANQAGQSIVTKRPATGSSISSAAVSSTGGSYVSGMTGSAVASTMLRAELQEETERRMKAEAELDKLRTMLGEGTVH